MERKLEDRQSNALTEVEKGDPCPEKEIHFRQNEGYLFIYVIIYCM